MVDIVDIVDNMVLVNNVNMVDSRGMVNMQKSFGFLVTLQDGQEGLGRKMEIVDTMVMPDSKDT